MITLFKCAQQGDYDGCLTALNSGIDPNIKFDRSWIPSDLKCPHTILDNYDKCLHALGNETDSISEYVGGWTPLHIAVINGHAQLLLDCGTNPNAVDDDGWNPIHVAVKRGCETCVRLLLDQGMNPNVKNIKYETTPYTMASCWSQELLFSYGADPYIKNNSGQVAKDESENLRIIKLLEQHECSVTKPAKNRLN